MGVFKEIAKADGSGTTTFYRLSSEEDTVETTSTDGTSTMIDYNSMLNKPSINDVALVGNKTLEDLGIQPAGDYLTTIPEEYITEEELASSDYATKQYVMEQINHIEHFSREVVEALPITGKPNVIYLVPKEKTNGDVYNEYIWTGADYELIGTTSPDLTIFYTKEEVDGKLEKKVAKVDGKGLSTNDYTTSEKTKLASLSNYDDSELRNAVNALHNYDDTAVRQEITALKTRATDLEADTSQLQTDIIKKTTLVRLIKAGDSWSWQDIEGNNITFDQAHEILGHQDALLMLEDIENDGKFMPLIYVSSGDAIHTFFMSDDKTLHALVGDDQLEDTVLGFFTTYNTSVASADILNNTDGLHGEVRRTEDTNDFYIYDDNAGKWLPFDKGAVVDLSNYLPKDNTIPYAPSTDYNPATKRYVDTEIDALFIPTKVSQLNNDSAFVNKTTTALENYYTKTNIYTKREVDALLDANSSTGVSNYNDLIDLPSINGVTLVGNKTADDLKLNNTTKIYAWDCSFTEVDTQIAITDETELENIRCFVEDYLAGKNVVLVLREEGMVILYPTMIAQVGSILAVNYIFDGEPKINDSDSEISKDGVVIMIDYSDTDDVITLTDVKYIYKKNSSNTFLDTNENYNTPYVPKYDGSPATKKYVDDITPTKVSELENDSKYIDLYDYRNDIGDGTNLFGWGSSATSGENMTEVYGMLPSEVSGVYIGARYSWPSRVSTTGTRYGVVEWMGYDRGYADDGTRYNMKDIMVAGDIYTYCYDDTTVYADVWGPDQTGGIVCFIGDTLVHTKDGLKPIQDINVGDKVLSINKCNEKLEYIDITDIASHTETEIYAIEVNKEVIRATGNHPFAVKEKGRCNARVLEKGDILQDKDGKEHPITKISKEKIDETVYEIYAGKNKTYFVGNTGILVYNEAKIK